ncbi:MAG: lipopolysaccharide biosynthesis protein, partial [Rhizobiaceae bacterium]|nr:lipopolysaccharide biosynthesis protein [Rhizobiaceae bacterium]
MIERILTWTAFILPRSHRSRVIAKLREYFNKLSADTTNGKSARAAMLVFTIRIISAVLAFILQVFLARWMGAYQYGIFVLVWVVALIAGGLSCVGLQTTVIRFITQYRTAKDRAHLYGVLLAAPAIAVGVSVLMAIISYGILSEIEGLLTEHYTLPFFLVLISLPILTLEAIQ